LKSPRKDPSERLQLLMDQFMKKPQQKRRFQLKMK
jgi:hypothetical protein